MKRTKPLRRSALPPRHRRPRARKPGKPRRRAGACRPYLDWLKEQKCVVTGRHTGQLENFTCGWRIVVDPAHVRVKRLGGDLWNALSLAHHLHLDQHQIGIKSWCSKHGITLEDLRRMAVEQTEEWLGTAAGRAWETGA